MKILVAGGTGYVGSHTIVDLLENGFEVVSADNGYNSKEAVLTGIEKITGIKIKNYKIDLCDKEAVQEIFEKELFDGVIHFAALKAVGESMEKPLLYFHNNIVSLLNCLEASNAYGVKAFIFSSSCTVYGDVKESPVDENTPLKEAESVYGRTKQMGEQIICDSSQVSNLKSVLLRYFNPAGAHSSGLIGEDAITPSINLIPAIVQTAAGKRKVLNVYGNDYNTRDGSCIRDYVHVMDISHAHTLALQNVLHGKQLDKVSIFNLGMGAGVTVLEAIQAFEKKIGVKINYDIVSRRSGDIAAIYCNYDKAKKELGWQPIYSIDDIMSSAWNWEQRKPE